MTHFFLKISTHYFYLEISHMHLFQFLLFRNISHASFSISLHMLLYCLNFLLTLSPFPILGRFLSFDVVRIYVIHLLGIYVTILYNWLILWQKVFYLYLGRTWMCLILQETLFQDQVLKPCKFVQDSSLKSAYH